MFKKHFNKIVNHITRGWDAEEGYANKRMKILPPFFYDALIYIIMAIILYKVIEYILSHHL